MMIVLSRTAQRALVRSSKRDLITDKIQALAENPLSLAQNTTRLRNRPHFRLRVQDWRVIFRIENDTLFVDDIGPRGSIYGE